jgi:hypothetical protein
MQDDRALLDLLPASCTQLGITATHLPASRRRSEEGCPEEGDGSECGALSSSRELKSGDGVRDRRRPGLSEEPREPRGVHNPRVVDLVHLDTERDEVVLLMLEERAWGTVPEQFEQLEDKFNSYLSYVLGGHLAEEYPQYAGKRVCFELECVGSPRSRELGLLTAMRNFAETENLGFRVKVLEAAL